MKKATFSLMFLAAIALVVGTAYAGGKKGQSVGKETRVLKAKSHSKTKVSGHSGVNRKLSSGKNRFVYALGWSERSDEPCFFGAADARWKPEDGSFWTGGWETYEECDLKKSSFKMVNFESDSDVDLEKGHFLGWTTERFVSGVRVCTSKKNNSSKERLKGIKIKSSTLDLATGKVEEDGAVERTERTNCKTWHDWVECPKGKIATAVIVQTNDDGARGLQLECAKPYFEVKSSVKESNKKVGGTIKR